MSAPETPAWAAPAWFLQPSELGVWCGRRKTTRLFATFEEAEAAARREFSAGRTFTTILRTEEPWRRDFWRTGVTVAHVTDDALGRIWTDACGQGHAFMPGGIVA